MTAEKERIITKHALRIYGSAIPYADVKAYLKEFLEEYAAASHIAAALQQESRGVLLELLREGVAEVTHLKHTYKDKGHGEKWLTKVEAYINQLPAPPNREAETDFIENLCDRMEDMGYSENSKFYGIYAKELREWYRSRMNKTQNVQVRDTTGDAPQIW